MRACVRATFTEFSLHSTASSYRQKLRNPVHSAPYRKSPKRTSLRVMNSPRCSGWRSSNWLNQSGHGLLRLLLKWTPPSDSVLPTGNSLQYPCNNSFPFCVWTRAPTCQETEQLFRHRTQTAATDKSKLPEKIELKPCSRCIMDYFSWVVGVDWKQPRAHSHLQLTSFCLHSDVRSRQ